MPNYGIYNRLIREHRDRATANDAAYLSALEERLKSLELVPTSALLDEQLKASNVWNLGAGVYGAFRHKAPHGHIRGVAAGAKFARTCRFDGHASVFGVEFSDDDHLDATELVRVGPDAVVSFVSCIFRRNLASDGNLIYMEENSAITGSVDSKAVFVGCIFLNGGTITINNVGGDATLVQAVGCVNGTGNASLGTVTETGTVGFNP